MLLVKSDSFLSANLGISLFQVFLVEYVSLAVLAEVFEHPLDERHRLGVSTHVTAVSLPVLHRLSLGVIFAVIRLRRRYLVAYALHCVLVRHHRRHLAVGIEPIFYVMLVAPLVMQPREAPSRRATAYAYRRAVALIIFHTLEKLRRRELRQIVHYPAPHDTAFTAMYENLVLVPPYQKKVLNRIFNKQTFTSRGPYCLLYHLRRRMSISAASMINVDFYYCLYQSYSEYFSAKYIAAVSGIDKSFFDM